jgi:glycosyltransferase involved in cell wall biosynthesis
MKIAIDARFLTHPQVGGFKTYTCNLIHALSQMDDTNSYLIYLDRHSDDPVLPQKGNFSYKVAAETLPVIGMPFREQVMLRRCLAEDKPDVVHFLCNTAQLGAPCKTVVTLHDTIQLTDAQGIRRIRKRADLRNFAITSYSKWAILGTIQAARRIITVSNFEKNQIIKHLDVLPHRVCVTHLAPNPLFSQASPDLKKGLRAEMPVKFGVLNRFILGVGYEPRKNIPLLIEAFSRIAEDLPDLDLIIVAAQDEKRSSFEQFVADKNLDQRVKILPGMSPKDLCILYNLAEVFVFPSERESFGLPPLEAIACGTPTIAMNSSSLPEILQDGALLIDDHDVQKWANAIKKVIEDRDLRANLAVRGLEQASKYSWQRCACETIAIYSAVVKENQP